MAQADDHQEPLRCAVVGYGLAGSVFHAPLIASTPGLEVAAVVTGDPSRQVRAASDHPRARIFAASDELWAQASRYEVAVIAAPNRAHVPLGLAALAAGMHLVMDKPAAPSAAGAEQLLAASVRANKRFTVFQNRRWDGDFLTVRALVERGVLGRISRFESRFERWRPEPRSGAWRESGEPDEAGGLLFDLGSHLIDQALVLFGRPTQVYAEAERRRPGVVVDDDSFVALRFADHVVAHLWMGAVAAIPGPRFRIFGVDGGFEKYGLDPQEDQLRAGLRPGQPGYGVDGRDRWGKLRTRAESGGPPDGEVESLPGSYPDFYARLRDAVRTGGPLPVDPNDSIAVLRVIEAAVQSARTHTTVQL